MLIKDFVVTPFMYVHTYCVRMYIVRFKLPFVMSRLREVLESVMMRALMMFRS